MGKKACRYVDEFRLDTLAGGSGAARRRPVQHT